MLSVDLIFKIAGLAIIVSVRCTQSSSRQAKRSTRGWSLLPE